MGNVSSEMSEDDGRHRSAMESLRIEDLAPPTTPSKNHGARSVNRMSPVVMPGGRKEYRLQRNETMNDSDPYRQQQKQ
eukprot:CAMPEP_0117037506 /NCGR_PEP_ID=MMETSP0472-20121206/26466_1 /TAXON_ID=693140 ORGANISM="Tiarina fusus, Strain LIS" /NCGR_SAMPLE_ID=MMETSP0472 /ASSEMBLY_ACC=CAM_ASM_000603 /LENGTH=77 /DNA_ID=CAMNT_0004747503 /DNA_START=171 /DNA_END=401 /DNA_ORIENTATION=-